MPTVVTGPANAILNVSGDRDWRFVGGIWFGLFFILFGLFAPSALQIGVALPQRFIATLAGLAMIPVLQSAFVSGFGGKFPLSALITFLTTVAGRVDLWDRGQRSGDLFSDMRSPASLNAGISPRSTRRK